MEREDSNEEKMEKEDSDEEKMEKIFDQEWGSEVREEREEIQLWLWFLLIHND